MEDQIALTYPSVVVGDQALGHLVEVGKGPELELRDDVVVPEVLVTGEE
jgi:hypothetical protein